MVFEKSQLFFNLSVFGNNATFKQLTDEESEALPNFVDYAGGLGRDVKSNLYKVLKFSEAKNLGNLGGAGTSFVFLSPDPNVLVERLEVLVGESLAGNTNAYREATAIYNEFLRLEEVSVIEYENGMNLFIK